MCARFLLLYWFLTSFTANHCAVLHAVTSRSLLLTVHACKHYVQLSNAGQVITCNIIVCNFVYFVHCSTFDAVELFVSIHGSTSDKELT